jgi:hypothetical protein
MSVKMQGLDRILEAISPALAAELDRVVQETREALQQEFHTRLQAGIREAEAAAASVARADQERSVEQARADTRTQVTAELERQFSERLESVTNQLKNEAAEQWAKLEAAANQVRNEAAQERAHLETAMTRLTEAMAKSKDEWTAELSKVEGERERWRIFAETQQQLADASSQSEMLARLLNVAQPFAHGLAVYVTKTDGLALWRSKGDAVFPKIISRETTDPESYFRPVTVRGKTVAAICAAPPFQAEALDFLAGSLERAIEAFALKLRTPPKQAV